jgi:hypothetical protein
METMLKSAPPCALALTLLLGFCIAEAADRQQCERDFSPHSGQPGKDVIWVPTPDDLVMSMLKVAGTTAQDHVIDLGAGDGKIPIMAAKHFGATAVGVEYNPEMVKLARCLAEAEGVADKVKIIQGDIFETDFSAATVLTLYLLPELNDRLKPTILELRPGTRVVSHSFLIGDWAPDQRLDEGMAYLWIVPAKVEGTWILEPEDDAPPLHLRMHQKHQQVEGTMSDGKKEEPLREASLRGDQLAFVYINRKGKRIEFSGNVNGEQMKLVAKGSRKEVSYTGKRA